MQTTGSDHQEREFKLFRGNAVNKQYYIANLPVTFMRNRDINQNLDSLKIERIVTEPPPRSENSRRIYIPKKIISYKIKEHRPKAPGQKPKPNDFIEYDGIPNTKDEVSNHYVLCHKVGDELHLYPLENIMKFDRVIQSDKSFEEIEQEVEKNKSGKTNRLKALMKKTKEEAKPEEVKEGEEEDEDDEEEELDEDGKKKKKKKGEEEDDDVNPFFAKKKRKFDEEEQEDEESDENEGEDEEDEDEKHFEKKKPKKETPGAPNINMLDEANRDGGDKSSGLESGNSGEELDDDDDEILFGTASEEGESRTMHNLRVWIETELANNKQALLDKVIQKYEQDVEPLRSTARKEAFRKIIAEKCVEKQRDGKVIISLKKK